MDAVTFRKTHTREFFRRFLSRELRPDGRGLCAARKRSITAQSVSSCCGSALVRAGKTVVLAGVSAEVGAPLAATPDRGYCVVNVDVPPLCSDAVRPGPPCDEAQALTVALQSLVDRNALVQPEALVLERGRLVWVLYVDIVCLNHDGNIADVALAALCAALGNCWLPEVVLKEGGVVQVTEERARRLAVGPPLASATVFLVDGNVLVDPTHEEEVIADSVVCATFCSDGRLARLSQSGGESIASEQLLQCLEVARSHARSWFEEIESAAAAAPARA